MQFWGYVVELLLGIALVACGGGGSGSSSSNASGNSACSIVSTSPLAASSFTGTVGSAQFSSGDSKLNYSGGAVWFLVLSI